MKNLSELSDNILAAKSDQNHYVFIDNINKLYQSDELSYKFDFNDDKMNDSQFNLSSSIGSNGNMSVNGTEIKESLQHDNYWALFALVLVVGTAAGNILVCLAIAWERRLQNVTNYFLMSLAITDLMVAILVMPLGILILVKGHFPLESVYCLAWICLDVLFCTASIMHLCTISIDRYLSLRYPMRFGRNKTRKRVTVKIIFVWLLSIAMSSPLGLMYSKNHPTLIVEGTCQIPDAVYKLVGSIVCFYIPLGVMLITYYLTVRLLARQQQSLCGSGSAVTSSQPNGWASGWLNQQPHLDRRCTWRRLLRTTLPPTPSHGHSGTSTDTELSTLDTHDLWLPDSSIPEPTPSTMTALHQFGAEMLKLSRGLDAVSSLVTPISSSSSTNSTGYIELTIQHKRPLQQPIDTLKLTRDEMSRPTSPTMPRVKKRRASHSTWAIDNRMNSVRCTNKIRRRFNSLPRTNQSKNDLCNDESTLNAVDENSIENEKPNKCIHEDKNEKISNGIDLPPPCTCPYFGTKTNQQKPNEVKIISTNSIGEFEPLLASTSSDTQKRTSTLSSAVSFSSTPTLHPISKHNLGSHSAVTTPATSPLPIPIRKMSFSHTKSNSVVTWDTRRSQKTRRGSSFGGHRTTLLLTPNKMPTVTSPLRRSVTLRNHNNILNDINITEGSTNKSAPCLFTQRSTVRSHHSRNSSVISRNSSRHGRIIRLEQKATKVLGVVFSTFVILWAPFFVLNLLPSICGECENRIPKWVYDVCVWLGYASSMVNPIFYTIFNKVFRQAFKKVLMCQYGETKWRPQR